MMTKGNIVVARALYRERREFFLEREDAEIQIALHADRNAGDFEIAAIGKINIPFKRETGEIFQHFNTAPDTVMRHSTQRRSLFKILHPNS
jgi:hypothetical protein